MQELLTSLWMRVKADQRWRAMAVTVIVAGAVGFPFTLVARNIEWSSLDWRFRARELLGLEPEWADELVIVAIDEASAADLPVRVPTPRDYLAELVERILAYRPRVLALDILLDRPTDREADRRLLRALQKASRVCKVILPFKREKGGILPPFQEAVTAVGFADVWVDGDAVVRRFPLRFPPGVGKVKSFPAVIYEVATGRSIEDLPVSDPLIINFRSALTAPSPYSAKRFFDRIFFPAREFFADKVVLIGATHADTRDSYFITPFYVSFRDVKRRYYTGVEVIAHALNTLLTHQFLRQPSPLFITFASVTLAFLTFLLLVKFPPAVGGGIAFLEAIGVIAFIFGVFIWGNWVIPITPFLGAIGAGYLGAFLRHFLWVRQTLQTAQERMAQMEKMRALSELASGVSHDVRNTLTSALISSELLLEEVTDPEWRANLETIRRSIQNAVDILNRLRLFSKRASEQEVLVPIDLNELVKETIALTHPKWYREPRRRGKEVTLRAELAPELPPVLGNPTELKQVLVNLIFNAVEAMPEGGLLAIRTWKAEKQVCLQVRDTGVGMTEEVKRHLFEPFFTTKGEQGTGLGLSICYGVVTRHQGTIEVDSAPGKGTAFTIRLPSASVPVARGAEFVPDLPPLRLLFVDDDEMVCASVAEMLRKAGHKVEVVHNGQVALQRYQPGAYEVVIVDWLMPGMDGLEVARVIKEMMPSQPVILATGSRQELDDPYGLPVDAVIMKPWTPEKLWRALRQALHASRERHA